MGVFSTSLRTHTCGELRAKNEGERVTLTGWVHSHRDHGGVIFIDLRDRFGITQIVFEPAHNQELHKEAEKIRREWVIQVEGVVRKRTPGMENPKIPTGEIEILADKLTILNKSKTPPFEIEDREKLTEETRFRYRYLDLRRPSMFKKLYFRHKAAQVVRNFLSENGFVEVETPMLVKSTPEGARDFIVPSRLHPGKFYALPQSPQLYKQILMVAGIDRYFQLARCLRDEDLRADRQPEHTQIDFEMSYVEEKDIHNLVENLMKKLFKELLGIDLETPFPRLTYKDAMLYYGSDKPDLRFDLKIVDVTDIVKDSEFSVFKSVVEKGGVVRCIAPKGEFSRKDLDDYIAFAQKNGAKGMAWMRYTEKGLESNIVKYFPEEIQQKLIERVKPEVGSVLMFIADKEKLTAEVIGKLRLKVAEDKGYIPDDPNLFKFVWIVDFPLFEWDEEKRKWEPAHHMFTMPKKEFIGKLKDDPGSVICSQFDLVLNGVELGSGSIRINDPKIQEEVMEVVGFPKEVAYERFGFLLKAFEYGAPPHGGMGLGFDRLVALMQGENDIREVIAFPKTSSGVSLIDDSPSEVTTEQLEELHIKIVKPK